MERLLSVVIINMKKHLTKPQYYIIINLESLREYKFVGVVGSKHIVGSEMFFKPPRRFKGEITIKFRRFYK